MSKETELYYRIDGRSPGRVMNKCPLTRKELDKLPLKEREYWTRLAGINDKDMRAFKQNRKAAERKLEGL